MARKRLSSVIRQRRLERGLTQEQLAEKAGVTKNYVTMVERGARKGISFMVRVLLADALGIPATQVLTAEEADALRLVDKALSLDGAEAVVWQLRHCLASQPRLTPTVSKFAAAVSIAIQVRPPSIVFDTKPSESDIQPYCSPKKKTSSMALSTVQMIFHVLPPSFVS